LVGYGLIFNLWIAALGLVFLVGALYGWCLEPADDPDAAHSHGAGHDDDDHSDLHSKPVAAEASHTELAPDPDPDSQNEAVSSG